ncbi:MULTISPECIES: type IV pilin-like G/H family protein [unclassified Microcoleus]|uniref:type IV pilin-like G/H family protein n=1 Tax=unclassified Microcoleus TaxID=2642155 RepID=UPI002FD00607
MKTEFKAKFLQQLNKRRQEEGFTLIELLVVIIIIGILSAIALPSFLSQANKAKQTEAKQYISSINKGTQAYFAENTKFTTDISVLGLGLKTDTTNYVYTINDGGTGTNGGSTSAASPKSKNTLKGYAGAVAVTAPDATGASGTQTILCETTGVGDPATISLSGSNTLCGTMTLVTK